MLDEDGTFEKRCNLSMVALEKVLPAAEQADDGTRHKRQGRRDAAQGLIEKHLAETGSERAKRILADWATYRAKFVKVFPNEYRRALKEMAAKQQKEAA